MENKTKNKINFCTKLPQGVRDQILANLDFEMSSNDWKTKKNLVTNDCMNQVWEKFIEKFSESNSTKPIIDFLTTILAALLDATERFISQEEREKNKSLEKKLVRQIDNVIETIREIDDRC